LDRSAKVNLVGPDPAATGSGSLLFNYHPCLKLLRKIEYEFEDEYDYSDWEEWGRCKFEVSNFEMRKQGEDATRM
jgi:hypothetical protein